MSVISCTRILSVIRQPRRRLLGLLLCVLAVTTVPAFAQDATLVGTVSDQLGAPLSGAAVTASRDGAQAGTATTNPDGTFSLTGLQAGQYDVTVSAPGLAAASTPVVLSAGSRASVRLALSVGPLQHSMVVTASASAVSTAQTGAPVTVVHADTMRALGVGDVLSALRVVPGTHAVQAGARGGAASAFIRGGAGNFNKVLVDGVAVNDIGGAFDFARLTTIGVDRVEVLRQTNSVMYGSDALAGVISLTTRTGRTRTPELTYAAEGGNLGSWASELGLGGTARRTAYYGAVAKADTDNALPNNAYRNTSVVGRVDAQVNPRTTVAGTFRRVRTVYGSPGAFDVLGLADDSVQRNVAGAGSAAAQVQWNDAWQSTVRVGVTDQTLRFENPTPSGEPFDPFGFGANYLGRQTTLRGGNGYAVTGRAILDFGGTYPSRFDSRMTRHALSASTSGQLGERVTLSGGGRFEVERAFDDPQGDASLTRKNGGAFVEARVAAARVFATAGVGVEHNAVFGTAVAPRVSVTAYLREPRASGLGETRLVANAGTGIKAPDAFQASSSLYALLKGTAVAGSVEPIGPERSRSFDIGVEQGLGRGRSRVRAVYFDNRFRDLIEFLSRTQLPRAGVPASVAGATSFGAYVNSQSYRARGLELSADAVVARDLRLTASYTYLTARVTQAFGASASTNPQFPGVAIGAFSPLVGERPFRRPTHAGSVSAIYTRGPMTLAVAASLVGARDDSTFATDGFFGTSMLLPNSKLDPAYQTVDATATYQLHRRVEVFVAGQNIANEAYAAAFGYPSLPRTARVGARVTLGGR